MKPFKLAKNDIIITTTTGILIPLIIMMGAYIVLNGHLSPGGGFSGGIVLSTVLILHNLTFGLKATRKFYTYRRFQQITVIGALFYALSKGYSFTTGAAGIDSGIPIGIPGNILSGGLIVPLNIAVGLIVASAIYGFFVVFTEGEFDDGDLMD